MVRPSGRLRGRAKKINRSGALYRASRSGGYVEDGMSIGTGNTARHSLTGEDRTVAFMDGVKQLPSRRPCTAKKASPEEVGDAAKKTCSGCLQMMCADDGQGRA